MEVVKTYKESLPSVKLVGKRFTDKDRDEFGTFARYWQQCFEEGWQNILKQCDGIPGVSDDLLGAMRMTSDAGAFEYWIGAFLALTAEVPDGYEAIEIPAGDLGVCWLYGNGKNGELYGMEASRLSMESFEKQGWQYSEEGWFLERYNCPRFTNPDEKGNVILDICSYLI